MALMGLVHPVACVKEGRGDTETDTPPVRFFVASLTTGGTHVPRRVGPGKATWPSTKEENPMTRRWLMKVRTHASRAAHGGLHLAVLLGLAVAFFFLLGTTPARAGSTAVTTCGQVLGAAGEYELTRDVGPCQGDGVVIAASGVHLTLAGHTISGVNPPSVCNFQTSTATQAGVRAEGPFTDLLINGGTITGFVQDIRLVGLPTAPLAFTVTAMTVTDSCELGIAVHFAQDGRIATSVVTGNG